ncbi:HupE/UreJ family protein [Thalassotalea sp. HSM 43]|uniref:HupE/UreJ family protein n=1 Tax=Thalassotalea sp. HSM 43 TaxID=2552945 RepID=UPI001081B46E|nr:HupE/UreJ family protein [Thalassotalea sp. HSM 43]QBY02993.1 HupE/UreJ family protein [Thalassotalea sp. HSM 43]
MLRYLLASWCLLASFVSVADDFRPASLTIQAIDQSQYEVLWKVPIKNNKAPAFAIIFDDQTIQQSPIRTRSLGSAYIQSWKISRAHGIGGLTLTIEGLKGSNYEAILRIITPDGNLLSTVLNTENDQYAVPTTLTMAKFDVFSSYTILGFEHILIGLDHLLFVLALILLVVGWKKLIWTITFFTLAHSITLAAVTLNWFTLPGPPVEAIIALSIVFLARELIYVYRGNDSITARYPWIVAFTFGLLHGMGFAGALGDIGLPQNEVLLALLSFNIGVELGQLTFVCAMLVVITAAKKWLSSLPKWSQQVPAYGIGTLASFWLIERLMLF